MKFPRKNKKSTASGIGILPIYTSLLGMILCTVCLAGSSWAWFTASTSATMPPMYAANMSVSSLSVSPDIPQTVSGSDSDTSSFYIEEAHTPYTVTTSFGGSASAGYLVVDTCDGTFYSTAKDTPLSFTLLLSQPSCVTVSALWGSPTDVASWSLLPTDGGYIGNGLLCTCDEMCRTVEKVITVPVGTEKQPDAPEISDAPDTTESAEDTQDIETSKETVTAEYPDTTVTASAETAPPAEETAVEPQIKTETLTVSVINTECALCAYDHKLCKSTFIPEESKPEETTEDTTEESTVESTADTPVDSTAESTEETTDETTAETAEDVTVESTVDGTQDIDPEPQPPQTETESLTEAVTEVTTETEAATSAVTEAVTEVETETESITETVTEAVTEIETETDSDPLPETEPEGVTETT